MLLCFAHSKKKGVVLNISNIKPMKKNTQFCYFLLIVLAVVVLPSVTISAQNSVNGKQLSLNDKDWFDGKDWMEGVLAQPDPSIDIAVFVDHYKKHPARWKKVFQFVKENDLANLPLGKQVLGDDVTVNVQEYITRDPGNEQLEGHMRYIDLQYVVDGSELQGYAKIGTAAETINPYNEKRDVAHFKVPVIEYHVIRPSQFTIFFPDDIHITNIQYGEKAKVRKVVFKVAVE